MGKKLLVLALIGLSTLVFSGCGKTTEPFNDADIRSKDDSPAEVGSMPDGFSNFSSKCDEHGNRVYVVYHGDNPYGAITVVPQDPTCPGATTTSTGG